MFESDVVAGAVDFNGTAGQGLFTFAEYSNFISEAYRPVVNSIWVSLDGNPATIQIFRGLSGTPAAERQLLAEGTSVNSAGILCRFVIPVDASGVPMQLFIITSGKSAQGRAELDWTIGRVDSA